MRTKESFDNRMEVAILLDSGFGLTSRTCTSSLCCPGNFARESNWMLASQSWPFIPWQSLRIPVTGHVLYFAGEKLHEYPPSPSGMHVFRHARGWGGDGWTVSLRSWCLFSGFVECVFLHYEIMLVVWRCYAFLYTLVQTCKLIIFSLISVDLHYGDVKSTIISHNADGNQEWGRFAHCCVLSSCRWCS